MRRFALYYVLLFLTLSLGGVYLIIRGTLLDQKVHPLRTWVEVKELPVACNWEVRQTSAMAKGFRLILQEGYRGKKRTIFLRWQNPGEPAGARILKEKLLKRPGRGKMLVGRSHFPNPIIVPKTARVLKIYKCRATAYTPGATDNSGLYAGVTALGWPAGYGVVAVDPRVIPLRSLLYVEGYGFAWAADTGGAIKGDRVDLCFPSKKKTDAYGIRKTYVYLVGRRGAKEPIMASANLFDQIRTDPGSLPLKKIKEGLKKEALKKAKHKKSRTKAVPTPGLTPAGEKS